MNDIDRMKGTIAYSADGCIVGSAPVSAMQNYQREVTAYTAGEGKLSVALKGYFPCHNTEEVVAQIGYDAQSDLENTADSVFCAQEQDSLCRGDPGVFLYAPAAGARAG